MKKHLILTFNLVEHTPIGRIDIHSDIYHALIIHDIIKPGDSCTVSNPRSLKKENHIIFAQSPIELNTELSTEQIKTVFTPLFTKWEKAVGFSNFNIDEL